MPQRRWLHGASPVRLAQFHRLNVTHMSVTTSYNHYLILSLSREKISLLRVNGSRCEEISDENFPLIIAEESGNGQSPGFSFGRLLKGFRTDNSISGEVKFIGLLRSADEHLRNYLRKGDSLLIAGPEKKIQEFEKITHNKSRIAGEIAGAYTVPELLAQSKSLISNLYLTEVNSLWK
jgi:hypothetical protein